MSKEVETTNQEVLEETAVESIACHYEAIEEELYFKPVLSIFLVSGENKQRVFVFDTVMKMHYFIEQEAHVERYVGDGYPMDIKTARTLDDCKFDELRDLSKALMDMSDEDFLYYIKYFAAACIQFINKENERLQVDDEELEMETTLTSAPIEEVVNNTPQQPTQSTQQTVEDPTQTATKALKQQIAAQQYYQQQVRSRQVAQTNMNNPYNTTVGQVNMQQQAQSQQDSSAYNTATKQATTQQYYPVDSKNQVIHYSLSSVFDRLMNKEELENKKEEIRLTILRYDANIYSNWIQSELTKLNVEYNYLLKIIDSNRYARWANNFKKGLNSIARMLLSPFKLIAKLFRNGFKAISEFVGGLFGKSSSTEDTTDQKYSYKGKSFKQIKDIEIKYFNDLIKRYESGELDQSDVEEFMRERIAFRAEQGHLDQTGNLTDRRWNFGCTGRSLKKFIRSTTDRKQIREELNDDAKEEFEELMDRLKYNEDVSDIDASLIVRHTNTIRLSIGQLALQPADVQSEVAILNFAKQANNDLALYQSGGKPSSQQPVYGYNYNTSYYNPYTAQQQMMQQAMNQQMAQQQMMQYQQAMNGNGQQGTTAQDIAFLNQYK